MNYLVHLYLAQPNAESYLGNLLGDFGGIRALPDASAQVSLGIKNHYFVDKFSDNHQLIKEAKALFSPDKRRFAGIIVDVLFDHFLISHWDLFAPNAYPEFDNYKQDCYRLLNSKLIDMPVKMRHVISRVMQNDWFESYKPIAGVGHALDNIARRIRFNNNFQNSIKEIEQHYEELNSTFLLFFPQLISEVKTQNIESLS